MSYAKTSKYSQVMHKLKSCKNLEDLEMSRVIENLQIKHSTLGLHRESCQHEHFKMTKVAKNAIFFKNLIISQKLSVKIFF